MKLRSPAIIAAAAVVIVQASGGISLVGNALIGVDNSIKAVVDLKALFTNIVIKPITPVVVPPIKHKKVAKR